MLNTVADILTKYRIYFFIGAVLLTVVSFTALPLPKFNGSLDGFNLEDNSQFKTFQKLDSTFGNSSKIYLQLIPDNDDRKETFQEVSLLTNVLLRKYPEMHIISPASFYKKMIRHWKKRRNSLADFFEEASKVPLLKQLIANDRQSFLLILTLPKKAEININEFDNLVKGTLSNSFDTQAMSKLHLNASIERHIQKDILLITIGILVFFLIFILMVFRGLLAAIYTFCVVVISIGASLSLFNFFDVDINLISILVIPIVLILSLSDSLHMLAGYVKFQAVENKEDRIKAVLAHYIIPSFFSSATTAAAFFSFYFFNDSVYIQQFGLITSIALMIEFVLTFSVTAFLLYSFDIKKITDKPIRGLSSFLYQKRRAFSYTLISILLISIYFVPNIEIESNSELFFPNGSEVLKAYNDFQNNFFSSVSLHVLLSSKEKSTSEKHEDELFNYVGELTEDIRKEKEVVNVNSATGKYEFITKLGTTVNLFKFLQSDNPFYNKEKNTYHIQVQFRNNDDIKSFQNTLENLILKKPKNVTIEYSSLALLMDETNSSISISLIKSLSTSGIFIFIILLLLTKSIKISLLSLIPNLIPLGFIILIYYFFDMHLNILTALTLVVGLGLLDDDTVHILYRKLWLKEPMEELNFSILSSAILLSGAFMIFMISSFEPIRVFGWVTALIFVIGVLCEMTIMQWILEQEIKTNRSLKKKLKKS